MELNFKKPHFGRGYPRPQEDKVLAMKLLKEGMSCRSVGRIVGVPHQTIVRWLKAKTDSLPLTVDPDNLSVVQVDELCTFVKKK